MSALYSQIQALLTDVILPNLKGIHANQVEQRFQSDCLNQDLEDFRAEMRIQFAELSAQLAVCRQELEDAMVILRESESVSAVDAVTAIKKTMIH